MSIPYSMGWRHDLPDFRDYTVSSPEVKDCIKMTSLRKVDKSTLDPTSDLRAYCSPIEDQGSIGSCTAHAGVGLLEYFERRACSKHIDASRLYLYKMTRNLMKERGDVGGYLRTCMGAMVMFGVPPEEYWPYNVAAYDTQPDAWIGDLANNYKTISYIRLDPPTMNKNDVLTSIKASLMSKIPAMFGFSVYQGIDQAGTNGEIPYPSEFESLSGGHAIMAVGHNDNKVIINKLNNQTTTGAFLIRNSWGTGWGDRGYGWLPYKYVTSGLADDWWTIIDAKYVDTGAFKA